MKSSIEKKFIKPRFAGLIAFAIFIIILQVVFSFYGNQHASKLPDVVFFKTEKAEPDLILSEFNPNTLSPEQWKKLGFTDKQVSTILKYKDVVGGQFTSKKQLQKCYAVSKSKFEQLAPFILLPDDRSQTKFSYSESSKEKKLNIKSKFNPDRFSQNDWMNLGFSEGQANAILKYKNYLGGSFQSKEKFKACFIISDENYRQISPYLLLPETAPERSQTSFASFSKTPVQQKDFDPNELTLEEWKNLEFSENQAKVILNYKEKILKGYFKTIDDVKNCFVISDKKFSELKPYIKIKLQNFPAVTTISTTAESKPVKNTVVTDFSNIDLNSITFRQLIEFGFDEKTAGSLIGFRKKLGGFVNTQQILDTYNIDTELAKKLINTCTLDESKVEKHTLADAPEEWLKNHPYFKYSADRIIYFRITYPDDKKIWKFLKLKPEYETRMKWYVK